MAFMCNRPSRAIIFARAWIVPCLECRLLPEFQGFRVVRVNLVCHLLQLHQAVRGRLETLYREPLQVCLSVTGRAYWLHIVTTRQQVMEAHRASQESLGIHSGRLFQGCRASPGFLGFRGSHRFQEARVFREFPGCQESRHQELLQAWRAFYAQCCYLLRHKLVVLENRGRNCTRMTHCCLRN